jgi:hypothetical protein
MRVLIVSGVLVLAALTGAPGAMAQSSPAASPAAPAVSPAARPASSEDSERLRERAAAFWAARVAGDFNKQWELLEPRGRGRMTPAEYAIDRNAVKYLAYQVEDATVNGYFGTVSVRLLLQPMLPKPGGAPLAPAAVVLPDKWVKIRGTWYHILDQEEAGAAGGGRQTPAE